MDATARAQRAEQSIFAVVEGDRHAMKVYFHERGCCSFYCATAPTASENAKRFCEMAALRVAVALSYVIIEDYFVCFLCETWM